MPKYNFPPSSETLYLIDISSFIFRAFYAIRELRNSKGLPTNAVYGVATMLSRFLDEAKPNFVAITQDSKGPSFREELFPEYKANRSEPPDDLIPQFEKVDQLCDLLGFHCLREKGVEADDIIASMCASWLRVSQKHKVVIVTGDKDLMQLVNDRVFIWDTMKEIVYDEAGVREKFGVDPNQIQDYLSLVGDSSDNIPGAPGIGPKTAVQLLTQYHSLDSILEAAKEGKISGKKGETLKESEKLVRLSKELVGLKSDVKVSVEPAEYAYQFQFSEPAQKFIQEMEFKNLFRAWTERHTGIGNGSHLTPSPAPASKPAVNLTESTFLTCDREDNFDSLLLEIQDAKEFSVDLETTSLNPRQAKIVGVALSTNDSVGHYIPVGHVNSGPQLDHDLVLKKLKPFLEDPKFKKVGQNLKYDASVLLAHGIRLEGIGADTMIAAYVLDPTGRHNLDTLCKKYLDYTPMSFEDVCGKGKNQITFDQVPIDLATRYSAEDALYSLKLWKQLKPELEQEKLMQVFAEIDLPLVPVLVDMESAGSAIDVPWLNELSSRFEKNLAEIQEEIFKYSKEPLNLNSPKQIAELLFEELKLPTQSKTKTGYSTDASVLEALAPLHRVPRLMLEYREISKLKGTYVDPLPLLIDPKTGKVHSSFHQTVTATGRLSSSDPNLQNIPARTERGQLIRKAFVPSPGNILISADYSQIELRILAHLSGDPALIASFRKGEDVHKRTASELYGIGPDQVTDSQRQLAKAINFGLMYGKTAFGLAQELQISRTEAKSMIDRYFERYRGVKNFLDQQIITAKEQGFTETALGRKRKLPELASNNPAIRGIGERMAMNTPIQGTAADLMKIAMIKVHDQLEKRDLKAKMIIQVHDEILLDCPLDEKSHVLDVVTGCMESAFPMSVPLVVNTSTGANWSEL